MSDYDSSYTPCRFKEGELLLIKPLSFGNGFTIDTGAKVLIRRCLGGSYHYPPRYLLMYMITPEFAYYSDWISEAQLVD